MECTSALHQPAGVGSQGGHIGSGELNGVSVPWWLGLEYSPKVRGLRGSSGGFCCGGMTGSKLLPLSMMSDGEELRTKTRRNKID